MTQTEQRKEKIASPVVLIDLKEEPPLKDGKKKHSSTRIKSIDFVRGLAIVLIIMAHTSGFWFDEDWMFLHGVVYASMDFVGPSLFVFLSALSVVFSIRKKQEKLPKKAIRNGIFSRGLTIMIIGIPYNLIAVNLTVEGYPFPLNLWGWNILTFLGFSQIASYYTVKLRKLPRLIIGIVIIFISDPFRFFLYSYKDANPLILILHYTITSSAATITLLPWLASCFISTVFGEYLYEAMVAGTNEAYVKLFRNFMISGSILVTFGVLTGLTLYTPETLPGGLTEYPHLLLFNIINTQHFIDFQLAGFPDFWIRGRMPNMFYNLGAGLLIIGVAFYFIDIKKKENIFITMLEFYGTISLSLFLIHYVFITLFLWQFEIVTYAFAYFAYIGFLGFMMYIWQNWAGGFGSPEWVMGQIGGRRKKK